MVSLLAVAGVMLAEGAVGVRAETGVGSWSPTGALPEGWDEGAAVTLADGRVLAVSGGEHGTTELYELSSSTWTKGPDLPASGDQWTVVALAEGGALLLGEAPCKIPEYKCRPTASTYRLGASGSELSPAAPMHEARGRPVAVRLADGRVLVAGGFGDECPEILADGFSCHPISSAEIYNPTSNEWSPAAPTPQARGGAGATLLSDGTVLVVGGDEATDAIRYEPGSGNWTAAGQTASSRTGSLVISLQGGRALALGSDHEAGFFGSLGGAAERAPCLGKPASSELFTTASDAWLVSLAPPASREGCGKPHGALLEGGQILLKTNVVPPSSVYVLDPEQRCWSPTSPPLEARFGGEVVALPGGRALVFGGQEADGHSLSSAEIYTPGTSPCAPRTQVGPPPGPPPPPPFAGATTARRKHLIVTAAGSVRVLVQCPASTAGSCVGRVRFALLAAAPGGAKSEARAKQQFLGEASFAIPAGKVVWVTVRVRNHMRILRAFIRRWRRAMVVLTTTAHDSTGQTVTTSAVGTLREPRHSAG